ncbi:hypothetical protein [Bremerella alba]|uniref:Lipoprotein n=1 Tax=Bremerella alba TaxID=980252 RepID=A0A7V8V3C0_9BACT|nr:hypothetical protein [Bremerella alba]MBA2114162.1 hypothetical protein [Bremerella alba]
MLQNTSYPLQALSLAVALSLLACGCQKEEGPTRYQVSGTVTFDGDPVPGGSIVFTPDSQKGNTGPQGTARIVEGHYDTAMEGRGTVGGPHHVHVIATEATTTQEAELLGPLAEHTFELDLPLDAATEDLEIPKRSR